MHPTNIIIRNWFVKVWQFLFRNLRMKVVVIFCKCTIKKELFDIVIEATGSWSNKSQVSDKGFDVVILHCLLCFVLYIMYLCYIMFSMFIHRHIRADIYVICELTCIKYVEVICIKTFYYYGMNHLPFSRIYRYIFMFWVLNKNVRKLFFIQNLSIPIKKW